MPRLTRLEFNDAVNYVHIRGRNESEIFFDAQRFRQFPHAAREAAQRALKFELLLAEACEECGAPLHGYCLEPNSASLVLRTRGLPLQALMLRLCGRYSRYLRGGGGLLQGQGLFRTRYDSKVVAPEYLPHAVRRVHCSPVVSGLCRRRVDYPFSSERAYIGERPYLPVDMADLRIGLENRGLFGLRGYREFMDQDETPYVANLLSHGSPLDSRIVGDKVFVQKARHMAEHPAVPPTSAQLIGGVARLLDKTPADIHTATHVGALGRALVAWYGLRTGAATLTQMGRWFSVTSAALGQGIQRHRSLTPDLFSLAVLPGLEDGSDG